MSELTKIIQSFVAFIDRLLDRFRVNNENIKRTGDVLFIGGGNEDPERRVRFSKYGVMIAGTHKAADVQGDWRVESFWERLAGANPRVVVLDLGSESYMDASVCDKVFDLLSKTGATLLVSPDKTEWTLDRLSMYHHPARYTITRFGDAPVRFLVALGPCLAERDDPLSTLLGELIYPGCEQLDSKEERQRCFKKLDNFGPSHKTFDEALAHQIPLLFELFKSPDIGIRWVEKGHQDSLAQIFNEASQLRDEEVFKWQPGTSTTSRRFALILLVLYPVTPRLSDSCFFTKLRECKAAADTVALVALRWGVDAPPLSFGGKELDITVIQLYWDSDHETNKKRLIGGRKNEPGLLQLRELIETARNGRR